MSTDRSLRTGSLGESAGQAPVRSGDPQRDWYLEAGRADSDAAGQFSNSSWDPHQLHRMSWRAEGAQDYPGGALETLLEIAERGRGISQRGRGPINRPSDTRLREIICERLTEDPGIDATDIDVRVENAEVTLEGAVLDRSQRRATEELIAELAAVAQVRNRLVIREDEIERRMSGL